MPPRKGKAPLRRKATPLFPGWILERLSPNSREQPRGCPLERIDQVKLEPVQVRLGRPDGYSRTSNRVE
jgi:hypothetical protein